MFDEWKASGVTIRLMKLLDADRESMKEGIIYGTFENEEEVKGRCRAIAIILNLEYEDLFPRTTVTPTQATQGVEQSYVQ